MRSMKLVALGALSLLSLAGCLQGQPRLYRVAVDVTPVRTIAVPSCFRNNNLPAGRGNITEQNFRSENEWVIWNGTDQTEYLDIGTQTYNLGDAPTIRITEVIEGTDKTFSKLEPHRMVGRLVALLEQAQIKPRIVSAVFHRIEERLGAHAG